MSLRKPQSRADLLESAGVIFHKTRDGRLAWEWGQRSSLDQHGETFETADEAAKHFLSTSEGFSLIRLYAHGEYTRGKQHRLDDFKLLEAHARDQAREIDRLKREIGEIKLANARRNNSGLRTLLRNMRKGRPEFLKS